jgi:hypothetical protein
MRIQFAVILSGVIALGEGRRADNFAMARGILQVESQLTVNDNYNERYEKQETLDETNSSTFSQEE